MLSKTYVTSSGPPITEEEITRRVFDVLKGYDKISSEKVFAILTMFI